MLSLRYTTGLQATFKPFKEITKPRRAESRDETPPYAFSNPSWAISNCTFLLGLAAPSLLSSCRSAVSPVRELNVVQLAHENYQTNLVLDAHAQRRHGVRGLEWCLEGGSLKFLAGCFS